MKNILLVDDNKYLLDGLIIHLRSQLSQCAILTALSGRNALEILEAKAVDFLLIDLQMPVMDGYELLALARERFPLLPISVMSGESSPAIEERVQAAGARLCIAKPINIAGLIPHIANELKVETRRLPMTGVWDRSKQRMPWAHTAH